MIRVFERIYNAQAYQLLLPSCSEVNINRRTLHDRMEIKNRLLHNYAT